MLRLELFLPFSLQADFKFVNTPLYTCSDESTRLVRLPVFLYGLCQREPKVPRLYKKHSAIQPVMPKMQFKPMNLLDQQMP